MWTDADRHSPWARLRPDQHRRPDLLPTRTPLAPVLPAVGLRKNEKKGFGRTDYRDLLTAAHQRLGAPLIVIGDNAHTHWMLGITEFAANNDWLTLVALPKYAPEISLDAAPDRLADLNGRLSRAKAEFENTFWDAAHHVYRRTTGTTPDNYQILLDTFFAENVTEQVGLPDVLDVNHMRDQLTTYYGVFMGARDSSGNLIGAPNTAPPLGSGAATGEVWTGVNYEVASAYVNAGKRFRDPSLVDDGITMSSAIAHQIWQTPGNGYAFDTPEAWHGDDPQKYRYPDYSRALAVWDDIDALQPIRPAR